MRDIIFRGKDFIGNWHFGLLAHIGNAWCISNKAGIATAFEVIPETVGQYTGLKDKNGEMIFEGDIVECTDINCVYGFTAVVLFGNPNCKYNWGFQLKRIGGAEANTDILLWVDMEDTGAYIEVVGNIHDKTELVEGDVMAKELKPCPFCGGKATIICCDDEGNLRGDDYEDDPWSGLGYQIRHSHEENEDCPIARYAEDGAIMGSVYIYDTREEAIKAWNRRASDEQIH